MMPNDGIKIDEDTIRSAVTKPGFRSLLQMGHWSDFEIDILIKLMTSDNQANTEELRGYISKAETIDHSHEGGESSYDFTISITQWSQFNSRYGKTEDIHAFNKKLKEMGLNQKVAMRIIEETVR
jgi:hypothetical protein